MTILGFVKWGRDLIPHLQSEENAPKLQNRGDNTFYGQDDVYLPELLEMFDGKPYGYVRIDYTDRQQVILFAENNRQDGSFSFS